METRVRLKPAKAKKMKLEITKAKITGQAPQRNSSRQAGTAQRKALRKRTGKKQAVKSAEPRGKSSVFETAEVTKSPSRSVSRKKAGSVGSAKAVPGPRAKRQAQRKRGNAVKKAVETGKGKNAQTSAKKPESALNGQNEEGRPSVENNARSLSNTITHEQQTNKHQTENPIGRTLPKTNHLTTIATNRKQTNGHSSLSVAGPTPPKTALTTDPLVTPAAHEKQTNKHHQVVSVGNWVPPPDTLPADPIVTSGPILRQTDRQHKGHGQTNRQH